MPSFSRFLALVSGVGSSSSYLSGGCPWRAMALAVGFDDGSLNKLGCGAVLEDLACSSPLLGHHGDGGLGEDGSEPSSGAMPRGSWAAEVPRSTSAVVHRRQLPSRLCFLWPNGGPPQPLDGGCSSSRLDAYAEDLRLRPGATQRRRPKWSVPGDGGAGSGVESFSSVRWRRTRWLFANKIQGSCCKSAGPVCSFSFFLDLFVNCNPTAGI